MSPFEQVIEFNSTVLGIAPRPLTYPIGPEVDHALKCLREEADEFAEAYQQGDFIGCVDANIDTIYFAIGNLHKMGLTAEQMEKIFTCVHNKNMTKSAGKVESRATDGAIDAVKGYGWIGPEADIATILDEVPRAKYSSGEPSVAVDVLAVDNPSNDPAFMRAKAEAETITSKDVGNMPDGIVG